MRLPGFAAHISLDRGTARYRMAKSATPLASSGKVLPQGCYYLSDGAKVCCSQVPYSNHSYCHVVYTTRIPSRPGADEGF